MRLPAPPIVRTYLLRGIVLWACARGILAVVVLFTAAPDAARVGLLDASAAPAVVALAVVLGLVDRRQWGQHVLLANLGVATRVTVVLSAAAAGVGELALALAGLGGGRG